MNEIFVRNSELKEWSNCRRKSHWQYRLGLKKKTVEKATKADIGTLVHLGLEHYYREGVNPEDVVNDWYDTLTDAERVLHVETIKFARLMLRGYLDWLADTGADSDLTVTSVERQLVVPFGEIHGVNVFVTGKFDLELVDSLGRPWLMDHKTVQSIKMNPADIMDEQRMTYSILRRLEDGTVFAGGIHNQLRRVLRTGTAKPPFYGRVPISFNDTQLRNHYLHISGKLNEVVAAELALEGAEDPVERDRLEHTLLPPNPNADCSWRCPYLTMCPLRDDGSDWEYVRDEWYTSEIEEVPVGIRG